VEADIFLVDGKLLVGHDRDKLQLDRTLESLYLAPLARRVRKNGGRVYQNGPRFFLLIDIKSDSQATYRHLENVPSKHADVLTTVGEDGKVRQAAVTAVITGARPRDEVTKTSPRYAGLDGRISDLDSDAPSHLMPMISDNWTDHFSWIGDGPMPAAERVKLKEIVSKAHAADRVVRLWATPENELVWTELRSSGVDLINTDQLDRLATFLRPVEGK
jgi:glycerophosphoryl diester phosphodiesterase